MSLERLLLLSCRSPFLDDSKIYSPMASLYLKSFVNREVPNVQVTLGDDDYKLTPEYFEPYDAIGISIMTPQRTEAEKILNIVKTYFPNKVIIAGGPHVKHYISEVVKQPWDWIVPLDGERPMVGIIKGQTDNFPHKYVRTGIKFEGDFPRRIAMDDITNPRILVNVMSKEDIENAPRPDRTSPNAKNVIKQYHYTLGGKESTTMMSARGCPEQCSFCEDAMTPVKRSSLTNIALELDDIKSLGYEGVYLFDDLFALSVKNSGEVGRLIAERGMIYRCNAQARYFTKWGEDMAKMLAETGCYEIAFGAESGSQKILDNIRKRTTVQSNYQTIEWANKHGIIVKAFILLGLPGETRETLKDTEKLVSYL
ncbi:MAG: radical SAM protein, partial [Nanoarchaeota archaeon]